MSPWEFWIDVGGTFTDCIARSPSGELLPVKVLSSGVTKGQVAEVQGTNRIVDPSRRGELKEFWTGYDLRFLDEHGETIATAKIASFHPRMGVLSLEQMLPPSVGPGTRYEMTAGEEAPILAIRTALALRLKEPIPTVNVRLGTTRGTNALLTRRGARTAFITTKGFADVLLIANQDRPRLFDLDIQKPEPLFATVVEIDERIDADGAVLREPDEGAIRAQLVALRGSLPVVSGQWEELRQSSTTDNSPIDSLAICLLHSFSNAAHELLVERIAREIGFTEVSVSSRLAPLIKIVSRGDTTVMDAYLNPILRKYVGDLKSQISNRKSRALNHNSEISNQGPTLKLMTSAGGLVDADRFVGKDSILSGPAGGVIGFSRIAQQAGYPRAIGFDMGGTSTDVARFGGEYEYEFETKKAGVRIVAPMLAIETVAAGGGSICDFDGVKLVVGPQSAGADPGPACYGRGGPLTVTDLNLWLGRIVPSRFPFSLDHVAVERRLVDLMGRLPDSEAHRVSDAVHKTDETNKTDVSDEPHEPYSSHKSYQTVPPRQSSSLDELAHGLCQIANANMIRAIRKISVVRGYDPADYALVCFGGAGAQHACAIAESLGMRRILIHPLASLLSAYGIGLADVRRFGERSVLRAYDDVTADEFELLFTELEQAARAEVAAEGIPPERMKLPIRSLDLRYVGVESVIRVTCPGDGNYAARYAELHCQIYGYAHSDRKLEVTVARVEFVGMTVDPVTPRQEVVERKPEPDETMQTFFGGSRQETPVFFRENLHAGDKFNGPALISEPSSTIMVEPSWTVLVLDRGEILLMARAKSSRGKQARRLQSSNIDRRPRRQVEEFVTAFRLYLAANHIGMNRDRTLVAQEAFAIVGPFEATRLIDNLAAHPKGRLVAQPRIYRGLRQLAESGLITLTKTEDGRDVYSVASFDVIPTVIEASASNPKRQRGRMLPEVSDSTADVSPASDEFNAESRGTTALADASGYLPEATPCDPVLLEIFNNLFASIAEQMGVMLQKTSCSTNVKERLDFSCAIFDPSGNLIVNAPHIPVHLGAMGETVQRIIADNSDELSPTSVRRSGNSVFVTNDPYRGGSHLPDVTVITPVRDTAGRLIFFTANRAHHAEIGGIVPGSMPPFSKTLGEEGVLIRNFKLINNGLFCEADLRTLLLSGPYPTRAINDNVADIRAQVAANQLGVRQLLELVEKHSLAVVQTYMGHIQQAAATKMRLALSAIPDGTYQRTDHLDDGSPICATIIKQGDSASVDFTGTGPVLSSNLNANRAIVTAAVMYVFRCLINEDLPLNSGVMEPITIVLPECLLNPPEQANPALNPAVVGGNVETSQRVVDVLFGALNVASASQGTMNNLTFGDATFGYYETICGGSGATSNADGADAVHTHMTNTRLTDVEVIERRYPIRVHEFSIRKGSGGTGQHRGGDGIVRKLEFLKPLNVSLLTERRGPFAPFGLNDGQPGSLGQNTLLKAGESEAIDLGGKAQIQVQPGDVLTIQTPGGGGFGS